MAFGNNSTLITSANVINVVADGGVASVYNGTAAADTFVIANGDVGDDSLLGFENNDSLITGKKIYDGNNDGYIAFGPNGVLDVDRTSSKFAGNDQLQLVSSGGDLTLLRYLGTKDNASFAYADASTRDQLLGSFSAATGVSQTADSSITQANKFESSVASETISASGAGGTAILFDNALGLNLGSDTVTGFGNDDLLIFTAKIYDSNGNQVITFGGNKVLDLSGANGPQATDPNGGPGGQLKIVDPSNTSIDYLGQKTIGDVTYYYYGHVGTALAPDGVTTGL